MAPTDSFQRFLVNQLDRIRRQMVRTPAHAPGSRKPSLDEQEGRCDEELEIDEKPATLPDGWSYVDLSQEDT